MVEWIRKLTDIGGVRLSDSDLKNIPHSENIPEQHIFDLLSLLQIKNGFYAFESSLHIFPAQTINSNIGIAEWNSQDLWISGYKGIADESLFFAEDVFGNQFCVRRDGVFSFNSETGELDYLASDINGWAREILIDYEALTGFPLSHEWQLENGKLENGKRLIPKTPFVLGGEYVKENLVAMDSLQAMLFRASLAIQIQNIPDGTEITIQQ
jgi:hypothetical protein